MIFVSPATSKVGGLCVKLILRPDPQAPGRPFLVFLVFRTLEVNRTTELKTCSPRLDISFTQFIRHVSFLFGVFQGSSLVDFDYGRNLFEFEQNSALPVLKGRLRSCLSYWHTIGAIFLAFFVIDTISFGYRIPFISTPCQARFSNNQSALNNASFVESAIAECSPHSRRR